MKRQRVPSGEGAGAADALKAGAAAPSEKQRIGDLIAITQKVARLAVLDALRLLVEWDDRQTWTKAEVIGRIRIVREASERCN